MDIFLNPKPQDFERGKLVSYSIPMAAKSSFVNFWGKVHSFVSPTVLSTAPEDSPEISTNARVRPICGLAIK
jgi:hypothetical protein